MVKLPIEKEPLFAARVNVTRVESLEFKILMEVFTSFMCEVVSVISPLTKKGFCALAEIEIIKRKRKIVIFIKVIVFKGNETIKAC